MTKVEALEMIAEDMKKAAKEFDGCFFDGKPVAEYFAYHGAAIAFLAGIMKSFINDSRERS